MRPTFALALAALAFFSSPASAQTWGQPYGQGQVTTWGQPRPDGLYQAYGPGGTDGRFGDPYAYRPPVRYDRYHGGQARAGDWTRGSSPPGRGYHDVYGYNDDRAPRGPDRSRSRDCYCGIGAYLFDR